MKQELRAWIQSKVDWPVLSTSIALKWLDDGDGLQDRSITRDHDWGIPVRRGDAPWPGIEGKVFYVWFDAPIEYIAATAEWADANRLGDDAWRRWWREDLGASDVRYIQFMAKDNVPFHTLSFPVTIMGANFDGREPWKLVDYIKGFNWLTYEGGKFSTSQGRGVFMDQALEILPSDYWRWWLLSNAPEGSDSDFTWAAFQAGVNKDLADVLGNFVSRVTKFCRSKFGEVVPGGNADGAAETEAAVAAEIGRRLKVYEAHWEAMEIRKAAAELRAIWVIGNEFLQTAAPWAAFKDDPDRAGATIRFALNLIRFYAIVSRPFIPDASDAMLGSLGIAGESNTWPDNVAKALCALPPGHAFTVPENLFAKITDEARAEMEARFAGEGTG
jgi:methionyl-tRNA synthetase